MQKSIGLIFERFSGESETENSPSLDKSEATDLIQTPEDKSTPEPKRTTFSNIDQFARSSRPEHEKSVYALASYLDQASDSEVGKARAIYVWLAEHIRYDDAGFNSGDYGDLRPEAVLQRREAVCDGYSNLFVALGEQMGLDVKKVNGYSKGFGYREGKRLREPDHAWNIVSINGQARICDATWGYGKGEAVKGKLVTTKNFDDYWFNVDPYEAIFNHFPENVNQAFVDADIDLRTYEKMPHLTAGMFKLGFKGADLLDQVLMDEDHEFPDVYAIETDVSFLKAPTSKKLKIGIPAEFKVRAADGKQVALVNAAGKWTKLEKTGDVFSINYTPDKRGELTINMQHRNGGDSYHTMLMYSVVRK